MKKEHWYTQTWAICLFVIVFLIAIGMAIISPKVEKEVDQLLETPIVTTTPATEEPIEQRIETNAYKLAYLEVGSEPPQALIDKFDSLLKELDRKCNENEDDIANYIFKGKKMIEDKGNTITLLEMAESMDKSIPEEVVGVISCAEIASAVVVLVNGEN